MHIIKGLRRGEKPLTESTKLCLWSSSSLCERPDFRLLPFPFSPGLVAQTLQCYLLFGVICLFFIFYPSCTRYSDGFRSRTQWLIPASVFLNAPWPFGPPPTHSPSSNPPFVLCKLFKSLLGFGPLPVVVLFLFPFPCVHLFYILNSPYEWGHTCLFLMQCHLLSADASPDSVCPGSLSKACR